MSSLFSRFLWYNIEFAIYNCKTSIRETWMPSKNGQTCWKIDRDGRKQIFPYCFRVFTDLRPHCLLFFTWFALISPPSSRCPLLISRFVLTPRSSSGEQFSRNGRMTRVSRQLLPLPFFKISDTMLLSRISAHVKTTEFPFCLFRDTTICWRIIVPSYVTSRAKISDLINENVHCSKRYDSTHLFIPTHIVESLIRKRTLPQEFVIRLKRFNYICG